MYFIKKAKKNPHLPLRSLAYKILIVFIYSNVERSPTHILTVTGAKGAWTQSNRDMAISLYDSWRRAHILREQVNIRVGLIF